LARYEQEWEPRLLQNPEVRQELMSDGLAKTATVRRVLGISEGESNFAAREFNNRHRDPEGERQRQQRWQDQMAAEAQDDNYYHVTLRTRWRKIRRQGLQPGAEPVFSNYTGHSAGRIFLTEKGGINFWKERVAAHEEHNVEHPQGVVVLRIPKTAVANVELDELGTTDAKHNSYYTTESIDPSHITVAEQQL